MTPPLWLVLQACVRPEPPGPVPMQTLGEAFEAHRRDVRWTDRPLLPDLGGAWQARAGRVRAWFLPDTTWIVDRAQARPRWKVGLTATAIGREDALRLLAEGTAHADGPAFERVRDGLVEWFRARPEGLEHGFTVLERPAGDGPLVLELSVAGAAPEARPDGARFVAGGRPLLDWDGLVVADADRRHLPASVTADGATLRVTIDDAGARWPVVIDPLLTVPSIGRLVSGGPSTPSRAGFSIDTDGEQLVLGNPGDPSSASGAAIVLGRNEGGADIWGEVARIELPAVARAGWSVAIDGPTVALASPLAGTVYVYRDDGTGFVQEGSVAPVGDALGTAMDLDDGTLVVGAPEASAGGADSGEVRVYSRSLGWAEVGAIPGTPGSRLGESVSLSGDSFVVGAPGGTSAAHVFRTSVDGAGPTMVATLSEPQHPSFGESVAMDGDRVAVGAPAGGEVFLYRRDSREPAGDTWVSEGVVVAPAGASPGFGSSIALAGDALAVTDHPNGGVAKVHLFERRAGAWAYVESLDAGWAGSLPVPVTLSASVLAVGLPEAGNANVQVWRRSGDEWLVQDEVGWNVIAPAEFGTAVAATGRRVVVGAPGDDLCGPECGAVATYVRDDRGAWTYVGDDTGSVSGGRYGATLAADGDLTLVGAPQDATAAAGAGRAELLAWDGAQNVLVRELPPDPSIPAADLVNLHWGDGVAIDQAAAVIGATGRDANGGAAFVYGRDVGGPDAWGPLWLDLGLGSSGDRMGKTVAIAEGSVIVGAGACDPVAGADAGCLDLYDLLTGALVQTIEGDAAGDRLGRAVTVDGDLMAVGVPARNGDDGEVRIFQRVGDGAPAWDPIATISPDPGSLEQFGDALALAGDRLYVGTHQGDAVHVYARNEGGPDAWGRTEILEGAAAGSRFGASVDADDDTLVVGEPWVVAPPEAGHAYFLQLDAEHAPVLADDAFDVPEDEPGGLVVAAPGVLANDRDPDGDPIGPLYVSQQAAHGTVGALAPDGTFTYTPDPDYVGSDSFRYAVDHDDGRIEATVLVDVTSTNDPPTAAADGPFQVQEGALLDVAAPGVLGNDDDPLDHPDGAHALTAEEVTVPPLTGLTLGSDGSFVYAPPADVPQLVQVYFDYVARDEGGLTSNVVRVSIEVQPVNDPPIGPDQLPPVTGLAEDTPFVVSAPGLLDPAYGISDPEGDTLVPVVTIPPQRGTLRVDASGAWRYTPEPEFSGVDGFTYALDDGEDRSAGIDVVLTVDAVNDPPVASPDGPFETEEDVALTLAPDVLLANDVDTESSSLSVAIDTQPAHGTVAVRPLSDDLVYTPDPGWSGQDAFGYAAVDADGGYAATLVTLEVVSVNDRPIAVDDDVGEIDEPVSPPSVLGNDHDDDEEPLTARLTSAPRGGELTFAADGTFAYAPFPEFVGADSFTYVAVDPAGAQSEPGTVRVVVLPVDGPAPPTTDTDDTGCEPSDWYHDGDGDGFGLDGSAVGACHAPVGHVARGGDCDDRRADVYPGARERADDGIDQDCDELDNVARPAGACDTSGGPGGMLALTLTLTLVRRRGDR